MFMKFGLTPVAALVVLTACGGGGGGGGGGTGSPPMPMATPAAVPATHLEMTDYVFVIRDPGRVAASDPDAVGTPMYTRTRRDEVVCPSGTTCSFPAGAAGGRNAHDGVWHSRQVARDASIAVHRAILRQGSVPAGQLGGQPAFRVDSRAPAAEVYGGWGDWSAFYAVWERDRFNALDLTWSAAFGELTGTRPTAVQGSATWRGGMVGRTRTGAVELQGGARLTYDFTAQALDLRLENVAPSAKATATGQTYSGPAGFTWLAVPVAANGTFGLPAGTNARAGTNPDPTQGQVDGAFYGPGAEEAAGVFERGGVAGAFGASRE